MRMSKVNRKLLQPTCFLAHQAQVSKHMIVCLNMVLTKLYIDVGVEFMSLLTVC